ncbi:DUF2065 family protein [Candidatus Enterovibrio altilux]|uniref:DUF2065 family protein n=1 Tax=Candidatus Enterovibrio altilux TaxID=1927128 RepID=UPI000BBB7DC6|nr:DUF2065 family protein [Candidatus Enterovibrio luxaltus]
MSNEILLALGLVLVVKGLGPMLIPEKWSTLVSEMSQLPNATLMRIGECLVVSGAIIAYIMWPSKSITSSKLCNN